MKKYLTLAAVLGALTFAGFSYLAQAEQPADPAKVEAAAPTDAQKDCVLAAAAKKADGSEPTAEEKAASVKACLEKAEAPHSENTETPAAK